MNTGDDTYLLDQGWEQQRARLAGMSAQFDRVTIRHLAAVGVSSGWHCLEVGAGTGTIAAWLAAAVGPAGRVQVTDIDTRFLDEVSGAPVEVVRHDVPRPTYGRAGSQPNSWLRPHRDWRPG